MSSGPLLCPLPWGDSGDTGPCPGRQLQGLKPSGPGWPPSSPDKLELKAPHLPEPGAGKASCPFIRREAGDQRWEGERTKHSPKLAANSRLGHSQLNMNCTVTVTNAAAQRHGETHREGYSATRRMTEHPLLTHEWPRCVTTDKPAPCSSSPSR